MKKLLDIRRKYQKKFLEKIEIKTIEDSKKFREKFNEEISQILSDFAKEDITIDERTSVLNLSKKIQDKISYGMLVLKYINDFFNDSKYKYNVVILLKSNKIKSFTIFENKKLKGFNYNTEYYFIDSVSVIKQNEEAFLFYKEGYGTPIDFSTAIYEDKTFNFELSGENLKSLIDGKAFKGIVQLGKETKGFFETFDWKILGIGLLVIIMVYLHMSGQIDLVQMFKLG